MPAPAPMSSRARQIRVAHSPRRSPARSRRALPPAPAPVCADTPMAGTRVSTLCCPECGHRSHEFMPPDACLYFFACPGCDRLLKPRPGDCCIFRSYGDEPCPCCSTSTSDGVRTLWTMATPGGVAELRLERHQDSRWNVLLSMNGRRLLTHGCESEDAGVELGMAIKRRWPSQRDGR